MANAYIKQLKDKTKTNAIYPVTRTKAIYDENNERLDNLLDRIATVGVVPEGEEFDIPGFNAETLGNLYTAQDITAIIAKLALLQPPSSAIFDSTNETVAVMGAYAYDSNEEMLTLLTTSSYDENTETITIL